VLTYFNRDKNKIEGRDIILKIANSTIDGAKKHLMLTAM
jgi:hypothetical protein